MSENVQSAALSRRTVTKAMAWAIPAVAVAAPVPAFAASGDKPVLHVGEACKSPGGNCSTFKFGYGTSATIENPSHKDIWITSIAITAQNPSSPAFSPAASVSLPLKVPAGGSVDLYLIGRSTNSSNIKDGSITFSLSWGHASDGSDFDHLDDPVTGTVTWASTPPGCPCI